MNYERTEDEKQEYSRLQEELILRLSNSYGDGAIHASFILLYYATVIGGLIQCLAIEDITLSFLLFGLISIVAFFFPIVVLHAFAVKFKENLKGLFNIGLFSLRYHEKPLIIKTNDIRGIKWELMHKNTITESSKYECKEYFLLAAASFFIYIIAMIVAVYMLITSQSISIFVAALVFVLYAVFLYVSALYLHKIYIATDLKRLNNIVEVIETFYEIQANRLSELKDGERQDILKVILALKEEEKYFNKFVSDRKIPDHEEIEIMKLYYGLKADNNDKHVIKTDEEAKANNKTVQELIKGI